MRSLIVLDGAQLRKIDQALAALAAETSSERLRKGSLFAALQRERAELVRPTRSGQRSATWA